MTDRVWPPRRMAPGREAVVMVMVPWVRRLCDSGGVPAQMKDRIANTERIRCPVGSPFDTSVVHLLVHTAGVRLRPVDVYAMFLLCGPEFYGLGELLCLGKAQCRDRAVAEMWGSG